ncbi:hypothetical protein HZS_6577 [Henneguya salminicola]|nr:hypothetical protein HZS_6577 [Henneguya salminicola]
MRQNRDGNLILTNPTVQNHAPNPEDLSKRRTISDFRIRARTAPEPFRRLLVTRNVQTIQQRINLHLTIQLDAAHLILSN